MIFNRINLFLLFIIDYIHSERATKFNHPNGLESSPLSYARGVFGGRVLLPCDVTPPTPSDARILVLFYKEKNKTPIYSLDSRDSKHYSGDPWGGDEYKQRARFQANTGNQGLLLQKVSPADEGLYRCRVDFKASPTRNSRIHLRIIEPPRHLVVTSKYKEERIVGKIAGPYPEGARITLSCQVTGGRPPPQVTWWHEGSLLDDLIEIRENDITRNTLQLPQLTRADLMMKLTCQAVNSNLTSPLSSTVSIDLAFPPNKIRIRLEDKSPSDAPLPYFINVKENDACPLTCEVEGTRPHAVITWSLDGHSTNKRYEMVNNTIHKYSDPENPIHTSTFTLIPRFADHGSVLVCKASNPQLPEQTLYDSVKLNVLYKPRVRLNEGTKINIKDILEKQDVYFECQVNANPEVTGITWTHNDLPLSLNKSAGVLLNSSGTSLILQDVSRESSGMYSCSASNSMGSEVSNSIELKVKFAPQCFPGQEFVYGGGVNESVHARCQIEAFPSPSGFYWAFNSSNGMIPISSQKIQVNGSVSAINHTVTSTNDFGTFYCWASNEIGNMSNPCIVRVIPAAVPNPVFDCKISNNDTTPESSELITCIAGWNGGLSQLFTLEVRKASISHTGVLSDQQHSDVPIFYVKGLQAGQEYIFTVIASNMKGSSDPVSLKHTTPGQVIAGLTHAHKPSDHIFNQYMPLIAIISGISITLTLCVIATICILKVKMRKKNENEKTSYFCSPSPVPKCDNYLQTSISPKSNKQSGISSNTNLISRYDSCDGVLLTVQQEKGCKTFTCHQSECYDNNETFEHNCLLSRVSRDIMVVPQSSMSYEQDAQDYQLNNDFEPTGSLGRASTLSSSSSASRPTFKSSQTTVVFNPKFNTLDKPSDYAVMDYPLSISSLPPPLPYCRTENEYTLCPVSKESSV